MFSISILYLGGLAILLVLIIIAAAISIQNKKRQ